MAKKKPLSPEGLEAIVDEFLGATARGDMSPGGLKGATARGGDIRRGHWPVQGVERRLKSLELMIEGWRNPDIKFYKKEYVDIAPGKDRIGTGDERKNPLRKATEDDIEALEAEVSRCRKMLDDLKGTPPKKVREKLIEIDKAIQILNNLENSITTQRPYAKVQKGQLKGQPARVEKSAEVRREKRDEQMKKALQDWNQHFLNNTRGVDNPTAATDRAIASKYKGSKGLPLNPRTVERWREKWRAQGWAPPERSGDQI